MNCLNCSKEIPNTQKFCSYKCTGIYYGPEASRRLKKKFLKKCFNPECNNQTENPKFCSHTCAASYNNTINPKRKPEHKCKNCGKNINNTHWYCSDECKKKSNPSTFLSDDDIFTKNSSRSRNFIKKKFMKFIKNECSICGQLPEWQGIKLVMVLDHINGVPNDNRKENLRLVCPNCNSQLETFTSKNIAFQKRNST